MKKRKLNSKNPKYLKEKREENVVRTFIREVNGVKIYTLKYV
tara:strand:+ start:4555 stop:4680 length:126 start_codon:yes stop_codon:yes gene_type:complete